jgi:nucleotide-binding universal stress UspA family protein
MEVETVLVPVDGSEESVEAVEYAVAVAERYGASLHALYVYGEGVVRGIEAGDIDQADAAAESESFLDTVDEVAGDVPVCSSSAYGFSLSRLSHHPGSVVLDAADEVAADVVVVPRESTTADSVAVLEKVAEYVLAHASQPVLSV